MAGENNIFWVLLLVCPFEKCEVVGQELVPSLEISTSSKNFSAMMTAKSVYYYSFTIEHSSSSGANAEGVHVTWMMASFLQFKGVTSLQPVHIGPSPKVAFKDDSWVFKIGTLNWGSSITVEFAVIFDPNATLVQGRHHLVTPVHLLYYDQYSEDQHGNITKGRFFTSPLNVVDLAFEVPGCTAPLGMKTEQIKTYQITASSSYPDTQPAQAREGDDAWCAKEINQNQYIQVDFEWKTRVTGLSTFRRKTKTHLITKYSLLYSNDDVTWQEYNENGFVKEFEGNSPPGSFDAVTHWLRHPIEANSFRIHPLEWEGLICLRFELFGCIIEGSPRNCISPLGLESGEIKDEALSHSLSSDYLSKPTNIRLNKVVTKYPFGWQAMTGIPDWLQVDLGSLRKLTRIAVMGGYTTNPTTFFFIQTYKIQYSNNSIDWVFYEHNGNKDLQGPRDSSEAKYPVLAKLAKPVVARYIRFVPNDAGAKSKVLRAELYGCNAEPLPPYDDVPEYSRRSYLLDPATDVFFVCMYTANGMESSCFSSKEGKMWEALDSFIISVIASIPKQRELYGLDRSMNLYRSKDTGKSWVQVDKRHYREQQGKNTVLASGVSERIVSGLPSANYTLVASNGVIWGVSATGVHMKTAELHPWSLVGSWKCCGN